MYKLTYEQGNSPDGTSFNDLPFAWKEITEAEFCQSGFQSNGWDKIEYRQMYNKTLDGKRDIRGRMLEARLFWFPDATGVAISTDYWGGKIRYFKFGCRHEVSEENKILEKDKKVICKKCESNLYQPWMDAINTDSGWSMNTFTSRPQRGIRDYDRTIKFNRVLSSEEVSSAQKFMATVSCPGWTGVSVTVISDSIKFFTTYDSSD